MAEYIERKRTVELLRSLGNREYRKEKGTIQDAIKMISYPEYTPTEDVAPVVHGRWIDMRESSKDVPECKCSDCGCVIIGLEKNYCPNCGARMDASAE